MLNFSLISTLMITFGILAVIFFNTNPTSSNSFTLTSFFLVLLVFLFCAFSIIARGIFKLTKRTNSTHAILRRSLLLSVLCVGLVSFSALNVLNIMSALTFVIALILVEFFFSSRKLEREMQ